VRVQRTTLSLDLAGSFDYPEGATPRRLSFQTSYLGILYKISLYNLACPLQARAYDKLSFEVRAKGESASPWLALVVLFISSYRAQRYLSTALRN